MRLFKKANNLIACIEYLKIKQQRIGFAPTMGALHNGHISLMSASKKENDLTISSIFVNPTQFNDPKDYEKYPSTLENDIYQLEASGCDILFYPAVSEIYPDKNFQLEQYDLGYLETVLEGKYRPGHFQGVCQVLYRLLSIVKPDTFYLGQKDYQQCMVVKKLIELCGWQNQIALRICPTLRDPDGLAMSSRNLRLEGDNRIKAAMISKVLGEIRQNIKPGDLTVIRKNAIGKLANAGFQVDYLEIAYRENLGLVNEWDGKQKLVVLAAAFIGGVRLIDNILVPETVD